MCLRPPEIPKQENVISSSAVKADTEATSPNIYSGGCSVNPDMNCVGINTDIDILSMTKRAATNEAPVAPITTSTNQSSQPNMPGDKQEHSSNQSDDFSFGIPSQAWLEVDLDPLEPAMELQLPHSHINPNLQHSKAIATPSSSEYTSHIQPVTLLSDNQAPTLAAPFSPKLPCPLLPLSTLDQNVKTSTPKISKGKQRISKDLQPNNATSTFGRKEDLPLCNYYDREAKPKVTLSPEVKPSSTSSILSDFTPELLTSDYEH